MTLVYRGREEVGLLIWQKWFDAAAKGTKLLYGVVRSLLHAGKINSAERGRGKHDDALKAPQCRRREHMMEGRKEAREKPSNNGGAKLTRSTHTHREGIECAMNISGAYLN